MEYFFHKNLQAIKKIRPDLYKKLNKINSNRRYEVFIEKNNINILDIEQNILFYNQPEDEINAKLKELEKYREYPFLYLFGVDNGKIIETLLENKNIMQLVVVEPNIELIYILFNLVDLSKDLIRNRLLVLEYSEVTYSLLINVMHVLNAKYYIRVFELIFSNRYYENIYFQEYKQIFQLWYKVLSYIARASGNDINDTFTGVKQHFNNFELMLGKPRYKDLLKTKSVDIAIVVSTGPSLNKQLPLLKKYQDSVCILSLDASFPILIEHGITPDFVFSIERDTPTAQFFKQVPKKHQQDSIFVCASLQHQELFKSIQSKDFLLVMRPFSYNSYFGLDDYGYLCKGMSSANMAHEFASALGFKHTVFIGQDLSFSKDLRTHAEGHKVANNPILDQMVKDRDFIELEAYGGKGIVYSNIYWEMFKNFIEHHIEESSHIMTTYNATEGGVRINGAKEISFANILKKLAKGKKEKIVLQHPKKKEINDLKKEVTKKILLLKESCVVLKTEIDKSFINVADKSKLLENKTVDEVIGILSLEDIVGLLNEISKIRHMIEDSDVYGKFLSGILTPLLFAMELEVATIKVRYVDNPRDNEIKAIQWTLAHRYWLFSISGIINNVISILENCSLLKGIAEKSSE